MRAGSPTDTGFQSDHDKRPAHANTRATRHTNVAEYMDTVNTVNILYISFDHFMANVFFQMLKS